MRYKLFGRTGLRVSEISLGTMTFGKDWGYGADKDESRKIFNAYKEAGGNLYDTANRYTDGTSEKYLGAFIKDANIRGEAVIASKYSLYTEPNKINDGGNHRKNLVQSVQGSLKRLGTDYLDILYVHAWDFTTAVDEVMRSLEDLVRSGKVLHIAASDTPAWIIARSNTMAELRGWSSFAGLQAEYSLIARDAERELLPMAKAMNLTVTAWAPLAGGALTGKYLSANESPKRLKEDSKRLNEKSRKIAQAVNDMAFDIGCSPAQVALRWVIQQSPQIIPIVGARNEAQLAENLAVVSLTLTDEQVHRLSTLSAIELGFPHDFLKSDGVQHVLHGGLANLIDQPHL